MFLERLELTDFRNVESLRLEFDTPLCLFVGANAQGKTSILEAVLLLALARSPRTSRDAEMVRWGQKEAVVRGEVRRRERPTVAVSLALRDDGSKTVKVDGLAARRVVEAVGEVNAVMFGPDDLRLVSGSPGERRGFLNTCIGQTNPRYLAALAGYRRVLRQRNSLLRDAGRRGVDRDLLAAYDEQLAREAAVLIVERQLRLADLARQAAEVHARLSAGGERLQLTYRPNVAAGEPREEAAAQAVRERLESRRDEELRRGVTVAGPHRDDFRITIDDVEARSYGSQGQQRTAALALKIAELRVVTEAVGEPPLLLLDDVLSELDDRRRSEVMSLTDEAEQVFLTCSQEQTWAEARRRQAASHRVEAGRVERLALEERP